MILPEGVTVDYSRLDKYFDRDERMLFPKDDILCNPKKPNEDICRVMDGAFSVPGAQCQCCCASEGPTCQFCKKTIGWHECPKMHGPFSLGDCKWRWKPGSL